MLSRSQLPCSSRRWSSSFLFLCTKLPPTCVFTTYKPRHLSSTNAQSTDSPPGFSVYARQLFTPSACARAITKCGEKRTKPYKFLFYAVCMGRTSYCYGFRKARSMEASAEIDSMRTKLNVSFPIRWIRFLCYSVQNFMTLFTLQIPTGM